jgi:hypothetical protein
LFLFSVEVPKLVIGHNVAYDRQRVVEEYSIADSGLRFLDTMSLHIITAGMSSNQQADWHRGKKISKQVNDAAADAGGEAPVGSETSTLDWTDHCSPPSLVECYRHWCQKGSFKE